MHVSGKPPSSIFFSITFKRAEGTPLSRVWSHSVEKKCWSVPLKGQQCDHPIRPHPNPALWALRALWSDTSWPLEGGTTMPARPTTICPAFCTHQRGSHFPGLIFMICNSCFRNNVLNSKHVVCLAPDIWLENKRAGCWTIVLHIFFFFCASIVGILQLF